MSQITITIDTPDTLERRDFEFEISEALIFGFKHDFEMRTIEPKCGRWLEDDNGDTVCSNCGKFEDEFVYGTENWYGVGESNYCPNCGDKMESEI